MSHTVFLYSESSAKRAVLQSYRRIAIPMAFAYLAIVALTVYEMNGKPVWKTASRAVNLTIVLTTVHAFCAGLHLSSLRSRRYQITPDAFSAGNIVIPREGVRSIVQRPFSIHVAGPTHSRAIGVTVELEGYAELVEALRAWVPPGIPWTFKKSSSRLPWIAAIVTILGVAFVPVLIRPYTQYFYMLFGSAVLLFPIFLRKKPIPTPYRLFFIVSSLFLGAGIFAIGLFFRPK